MSETCRECKRKKNVKAFSGTLCIKERLNMAVMLYVTCSRAVNGVKQCFNISCAQMFKKSAVCYRQIHMCFGSNKHYNQYLSMNQLLSPQLKIQGQGSTFTITDEYTGDHFNSERNYFMKSDIVNNHIPFVPSNDFLWVRTRILCLNHRLFNSLLLPFRNLQPLAWTK